MKQTHGDSQEGKEEVGEAGREEGIEGEEDKKWKPMDGGGRGGREQGDPVGGAKFSLCSRGSQVYCSAKHIISCLPYGF